MFQGNYFLYPLPLCLRHQVLCYYFPSWFTLYCYVPFIFSVQQVQQGTPFYVALADSQLIIHEIIAISSSHCLSPWLREFFIQSLYFFIHSLYFFIQCYIFCQGEQNDEISRKLWRGIFRKPGERLEGVIEEINLLHKWRRMDRKLFGCAHCESKRLSRVTVMMKWQIK